MAQEMEKLGGTSEEADEEMDMEVKEEDEEEEEEEEGASGSGGAVVMGLAAPAAGEDMGGRYFEQPGGIDGGGGDGLMQGVVMRRPRPKEEKERTKMRERHRRAITARILSGLRRHGSYNLRARADINEVIGALAREAGWAVLPDGTTFPSRSSASSSPQVTDIPSTHRMPEHDFAGTPYVPVYVMLPLGVINMKCELADPESLIKQLRILKSVNVDGVMVDCWWGIVEAHTPQEYCWHGYKRLFQTVRELKLKLQVVMSFHECGGNIGDDVCIPLPHWVAEIGRSNPEIFFTDREGRQNPECLSWGIDKERVLRGRTALEVYFDYMRGFRVEFDEFFEDGIISEIEVGLGPSGELRYPSYPVKYGWRYPGIGEFQCYDLYLMKSLRKAAEARGHSFWARGPDNAGSYNSQPHETGFFCGGGDYNSYYGRFFLNWYSQVLVDHADRVLSLAKLAFEGTCIAAKVSGIHWWYKTASHAAELTAGFYNPCNRDGYASIASMLKRHGAALKFTCAELRTLDQHEEFPEALADPEGLVWQVLNAAWDVCIPVASENSLPCHDRSGYNKILENSKPMSDPDGRHLATFTYLRLSPDLMESHNFLEFERFVKRMHGEAVLDLQS
ncbi:beta-amylase 2, chloroplastic isoform X3 [Phoenix dactylifera]|uniref:Beta-amylase n=1 Tax=Phoenix dactylifera TaxID=42345 RepID=A0A8B8IZZ0_PHODC|nr:beta-amylase 2, chloroplastic isoform X3 [Phoenix dactylifera]